MTDTLRAALEAIARMSPHSPANGAITIARNALTLDTQERAAPPAAPEPRCEVSIRGLPCRLLEADHPHVVKNRPEYDHDFAAPEPRCRCGYLQDVPWHHVITEPGHLACHPFTPAPPTGDAS
jgi:hypothetical protein